MRLTKKMPPAIGRCGVALARWGHRVRFGPVYDLQLIQDRWADSFIVSFPKSGRSWLRYLLQQYLVRAYGVACPPGCDVTELVRRIPQAPGFTFVHDGSSYHCPANPPAHALCADRRFYRSKNVLLLVRDLRDVMASYYAHATRRQRVYDGTISQFIRDERFGVAKATRFLNIWAAARDVPRSLSVVRYEDLMRNPTGEFLRVIRCLGLRVDVAAAVAAADEARFERMKLSERQGRLNCGEVFGPGETGGEDGFKVRKGRVAGFLDEFAADDIRYLTDYLNAELDPFYGYAHLWADQVDARLEAEATPQAA